MKQFLLWPHGRSVNQFLMYLVMAIVCFTSCMKSEDGFRDDFKPSSFSSDDIDKWFTLETRLFKDAQLIYNSAFSRPFAYSGICAYESNDPRPRSWHNN